MADDPDPLDSRPDLLPAHPYEHRRLIATMAELRGVARYSDLAGRGQREVSAGCGDRVIVRNGRGSPSTWAGTPSAWRPVVGRRAQSSQRGPQHGWPLKKMPYRLHVTARPNRHARACVCKPLRVYHRMLPQEEIVGGVTEPLRTVVDCARDLALDEASRWPTRPCGSGRSGTKT